MDSVGMFVVVHISGRQFLTTCVTFVIIFKGELTVLHLPVLQVDSRGVLPKMKVPPWSIFQAILLSTFTAIEFEVLINLRKKSLPKKAVSNGYVSSICQPFLSLKISKSSVNCPLGIGATCLKEESFFTAIYFVVGRMPLEIRMLT